jgi:hypothetical protein
MRALILHFTAKASPAPSNAANLVAVARALADRPIPDPAR